MVWQRQHHRRSLSQLSPAWAYRHTNHVVPGCISRRCLRYHSMRLLMRCPPDVGTGVVSFESWALLAALLVLAFLAVSPKAHGVCLRTKRSKRGRQTAS